jgi:hypothetical protein
VGAVSLVSSPAPFALINVLRIEGASAQSTVDDILFSGPGATVKTHVLIPFHAQFNLAIDDLANLQGDVFKGTASAGLQFGANMQCGISCGFGGVVGVDFNAPDPFTPKVQTTMSFGTIAYDLTFQGEFVQLITTTPIFGEPYAGANFRREYALDGYFDSGLTTVPVGVPITMQFTVQTGVQTISFFVSGASGFMNAIDTLGLPQGVPVFDLPAGYSVDAPSIGLVNNVIPAAAGPIVGVPAPASLGLMLSGLAVVGWLGRRVSQRGWRRAGKGR